MTALVPVGMSSLSDKPNLSCKGSLTILDIFVEAELVRGEFGNIITVVLMVYDFCFLTHFILSSFYRQYVYSVLMIQGE